MAWFLLGGTAFAVKMSGSANGLAKEMQHKMTKEEEEDQKIHDEKACWCNSNIFEKTTAVNTNKRKIIALNDSIQRLTVDSERWRAEKEQLSKEILNAKAAQSSAEEEDKKQLEDFKREESRLLGLVDEIAEAHRKIEPSLIAKLRKKVVQAEGKHLRAGQVESFLREKPQTEGVVAVLDRLESDVVANLGTVRSKETQRAQSFQLIIEDKKAEEKALEERKQAKSEAIAEAAEQISNSNEVISNAEIQVEEDSELLADVKAKCERMEKEWNQRQKTRAEEEAAIKKTAEILKKASLGLIQLQDIEHKSFLQVEESRSSLHRKKLADELLKAAVYDLRLVSLAMRAKIDSFTNVRIAIRNMSQSLEREQNDEVRQKEYCVEQFEKNKMDMEAKNRTIRAQSADTLKLEAEIQAAGNQATNLQKEIGSLEEQMRLASQSREKENSEFQTLVLEQREMKASLQQAMSVLQSQFSQAEGSFAQTKGAAAGGSGQVMEMLLELIKDSEAMIAEAMEAEQTSQESFEAFTSKTNAAVAVKQNGISKENKWRGMQAVLLAETSEAKHLTTSELKQLLAMKGQLHESCDFLLSRFDVRQKARAEEMKALNRAESALSGDA